jgi:hypothetical protein
MNTITMWANRHDYAKLILITLAMMFFMLLVLASLLANMDCMPLLLAGMGFCFVAGYWLGNWKWILIPLLAMLMEIAVFVPVVMRDPSGGETPISVVVEAPFWTGLPALIGASTGYLKKRMTKKAGD